MRIDPLRGRRLPRRLGQLYLGLVCYGASSALMVRANLGLDPWDVFHQGLAKRLDLPLGWVVIGIGVLVLLVWIPLRQRPGLGTISNVILVGLALDATLTVVSTPGTLWARWLMLLASIALNGLATGMYIGARFGPGPRDGLMTGLAARGHSVRVVRTGIELAVLAAGFLLGGQVGFGTLLYAVSIGPLAHVLIPLCTVRTTVPEPA
ncbi:MAG TPA: hypothetical protein VGN37_24020 [Actinocatenispora sp.]